MGDEFFFLIPYLLLTPPSPLVLYFLPLRLCTFASLRSIPAGLEY
jgi:hypothetical protein